MYLLNYDFYDLHALFVFFRSKPDRFPHYRPAVEQLIGYIGEPAVQNGIDTNTVRKILQPFRSDDDDTLSWVDVNNEYTANIRIIKNQSCYDIIRAVLTEMTVCSEDTDRLYLLCDAVHNIPLILADEPKPSAALKACIAEYRSRYSKSFLSTEIKSI